MFHVSTEKSQPEVSKFFLLFLGKNLSLRYSKAMLINVHRHLHKIQNESVL